MFLAEEHIRGEVSEVGVDGDRNRLRKREVRRAELVSENNKIIDMKNVGGDTEGRENNKIEELQEDELNGNDDCTVLRITAGHDENEGGVT